MSGENVYQAPSTTDVVGFSRWLGKRWEQAFADLCQPKGEATSNWASLLGHKCLRHIYYARTGAEQEPTSPRTQMIFESGNMIEHDTVSFLRTQLDIEFVRSQQSAPKDVLNIGLKIDGGMRGFRNASDPFLIAEIKRVNQREWAKITDADIQGIHDMISKCSWWINRYPTQGAIYLHYFKEPGLIFVLREPSSGACKFVPMPADASITQQLWEEAKQKAITINAAVESNEIPDRMTFHRQTCEMCGFRETACFPEQAHKGLDILDHPDLVEAARELLDLQDLAKRAKGLKEYLRDIILQTGRDHIVIGDVAEAKVQASGKGKSVRITALKNGLFFGEDDDE